MAYCNGRDRPPETVRDMARQGSWTGSWLAGPVATNKVKPHFFPYDSGMSCIAGTLYF